MDPPQQWTNPSSVLANPWRIEWQEEEVLPPVDLRNDIVRESESMTDDDDDYDLMLLGAPTV